MWEVLKEVSAWAESNTFRLSAQAAVPDEASEPYCNVADLLVSW